MKKKMVTDEEIAKIGESLFLIVGNFVDNGFHGYIRIMGWKRIGNKNTRIFRFCFDYDEEGYWDLKKLLDDSLELIAKNTDRYFPVAASITGIANQNPEDLELAF